MGFQPLPVVTADSASFWEGGAEGALHIHRCRSCRTWFHPPTPVCPACVSLDVGPEVVSGRASVRGYSVNVQPWAPDMEVPYVVAVVGLDDAPDVHLTTRLVDVDPQDVRIGMPLEVTFLHVEDVWLPLFRPAVAAGEVAP